jgi:hypothetical protein
LLLSFHFHKTLGAARDFNFDVSSVNPSWISDVEDEDPARNARRLPARRPHELPNPNPAREQNIAALMELGFSNEVAAGALALAAGNLQAAINHLVGE